MFGLQLYIPMVPRTATKSVGAAFALSVLAVQALAQNIPADAVTANGTPPVWGHSSCSASLSELSDGDISNPGVCYLAPLDPAFEITFQFSPSNAQFMTGIDIWANAGNNMNDNELRRLDVEVDYFDPATNSTQTQMLNDVNIGDTTSFNDPKFVSFGGAGLYQVSEVRIRDMVGTSASGRVVFREIQGVFATQPVAPEIAIDSTESGSVLDGGTDGQGVETSGVAQTVTYTVTNTGTDTLTLAGTPTVSNETNLSGTVSVTAPASPSLSPGDSTTFDVTYTPLAAGPFSFDLDVESNDGDEATFDIAVAGTANDAPGVVLTSVAQPGGLFSVTATFSEDVTGMTLGDFSVTNGVATGFSNPSPGVFTVSITPTDPLLPVGVFVPAGAASDGDGEQNTASNTLSLLVIGAPTPPELAAIEDIIQNEAIEDLRSGIAFNQRANRDARSRYAGFLSCRNVEDETRRGMNLQNRYREACPEILELTIEPKFEGKFSTTDDGISGSGSYFAQASNDDGSKRRLAFAEFSLRRTEGGSSSASVEGRVAWERLLGADAMRGLFVGANGTLSDIDDDFDGSRLGYGLNAGAYFVDQLEKNLFWDGFISLGIGRNNLDLGNGSIDVEGDYNTSSILVGLALTGERAFENFVVHPELSVAYGVTSIGDAALVSTSITGTATDSISGSDVSLGVVRFRPEFVFPDKQSQFGTLRNRFSVAPSILCESIRTDVTINDCGGGIELEWSAIRANGGGYFSAQASREIVGGIARDRLSALFEREF